VLLRAGDLRFGYTPARLVIDDVSLDLAEGTAVGILGPNGSGKTTLMRLLSGGLTPQTGVARLDGVDVRSFRPTALARRIAVVPQETSLAFDYTALEIVLMGRYPHLSAFEVEGPHDLAIADAALESTGTRALAERAFRSLSGGEKQRVIIAAALAQSSDILLLDEPTTALDIGYQFEIAALLKQLNADHGTTMVVSTHDLNLAAALCERVVLIKSGGVIAQGPTAETLTAHNIRLLYDVDADVQFHERAGHLTVVPLGRA